MKQGTDALQHIQHDLCILVLQREQLLATMGDFSRALNSRRSIVSWQAIRLKEGLLQRLFWKGGNLTLTTDDIASPRASTSLTEASSVFCCSVGLQGELATPEVALYGNSVGVNAVRSFESRSSALGGGEKSAVESGGGRWRRDSALNSAEGGPSSYFEPRKVGCAFAAGAHERSHGMSGRNGPTSSVNSG